MSVTLVVVIIVFFVMLIAQAGNRWEQQRASQTTGDSS
jgi:hypothetical protein